MAMRLFDTMSRRLAEVKPLEEGHVRLYTCGPTVYQRAHIGNFRTFVFEDVLRRWLERRFPRVTHVMNLTDVEDKIIRNAVAHGHSLDEETAPHIEGFFEDLDALGIRRAHSYPRATHYIDQMVGIINALDARGLTYRNEGSVYFHIAAFPNYGRLSGVRAEGLVAGASGRMDADEYDKEDVRDFALWKAVGADEIGWDTPLGRGRPGWHIECSAMSMAELGESIDIHCGGVDNMFPHHENEIAQSEGATGKPFVSIWCHSQHLRIGGEKMAKSLGNFTTLRELLDAGTRPSAVRYLLAANAHYRKPMAYSDENLHMAGEAVDRFAEFAERVADLKPGSADDEGFANVVDKQSAAFDEAMDNDLNLTTAMGEAFWALREINRRLDDAAAPSARNIKALQAFIDGVDDVLGVLPLVRREREAQLGPEPRALLELRVAARAERNWKESDRLRDALAEMGIAVEDTPAGQRWRPRRS
jgi:cysteinyl-tRNA synthetase